MNRLDICLQDEVPAVKSLQMTVQDGVALFYSSSFPAQWCCILPGGKAPPHWRCFFVIFLDLSGQNMPPNFDMLIVDSSFSRA